jgi:hypothetical protein
MPPSTRRMRFHWRLPSSGVSDKRRGARFRTEINQSRPATRWPRTPANVAGRRLPNGARRPRNRWVSQTYRLAEEQPSWLTPYPWTGLVPYMGPMSISLIGSPDEIVESIFEYRRIGVTQFMFQASAGQ